jgi:hypothetical protein
MAEWFKAAALRFGCSRAASPGVSRIVLKAARFLVLVSFSIPTRPVQLRSKPGSKR